MKLFGTMTLDADQRLAIGGLSVFELARRFDTPLYVLDTAHVKAQCALYRQAFTAPGADTEVIYASKAFLTVAMARLIQAEGLSLDVVSGGELYTAITAGFPADRIYFHGNNKTAEELLMALDYGVHRIIVDNGQELALLSRLCRQLGKRQHILFRMNPGIDAHTHDFIQTARNDSKFGISIYQEDICGLIRQAADDEHLILTGFHCHIGSQIFDEAPYFSALSVMFDFLGQVRDQCHFTAAELNLGGGFGVFYSEGDDPMALEPCLSRLAAQAVRESQQRQFPTPRLMIEPGRSIVANAGTTLYQVGAVKQTYAGKQFIFVDGGMTDNPRTALYDSKYEAHISHAGQSGPVQPFTVAGKCCESGDVLIHSIALPEPQPGDILAINGTGAYNYSMSSNYNRIRKPAVVFVENGEARLAVKRETYEDLIRNDVR